MRAVVTGSTGFIGKHLTARLTEIGWDVVPFVRQNTDTSNGVISDGSVVHLTEQLQRIKPDVVFHLATKFVGVHKPEDIDDLVESNIGLGTRLLEALNTLENVAFVNVGTVWQHVFSRSYSPASLYAATKQSFEDILRFYCECGNVRGVSLELTDTYGPGDTRKKLVNILLERLDTNDTLDMNGGDAFFDLIHVRDAVEGLVTSVEHASHDLPSYGLFTAQPAKLREFVAAVEAITNKTAPVNWGARPYRVREMMEPWRATPLLPGWQPKVSLQAGILEMLN